MFNFFFVRFSYFLKKKKKKKEAKKKASMYSGARGQTRCGAETEKLFVNVMMTVLTSSLFIQLHSAKQFSISIIKGKHFIKLCAMYINDSTVTRLSASTMLLLYQQAR